MIVGTILNIYFDTNIIISITFTFSCYLSDYIRCSIFIKTIALVFP